MKRSAAPRTARATEVHLRIARLVVDAGAFEGLSQAQLRTELHEALARQLSGQTAIDRTSSTLANQVAAAVAPQVRLRLPSATGEPR